MDTLDQYRDTIEKVLAAVTDSPSDEVGVVERTIFDRQSDSYLVIAEGWNGEERTHRCLVHIEIINAKVWIQKDSIEYGIATDLEKAGIPKTAIVLGFHPPDVRSFTGYAADILPFEKISPQFEHLRAA
jgi:hypothetical protein